MAWNVPMTAVANAIFTAAQFNTYVRDNLMETAPAKANTAGSYFVTSGVNSISERSMNSAFQLNSGTTTSTSYTATLSGTPGTNPSVSVSTGSSAVVLMSARMSVSTTGGWAIMSVAVSGATTIAATDDYALQYKPANTSSVERWGVSHAFTNLTPGTNTFTLQYESAGASNTATFQNRELVVIPF